MRRGFWRSCVAAVGVIVVAGVEACTISPSMQREPGASMESAPTRATGKDGDTRSASVQPPLPQGNGRNHPAHADESAKPTEEAPRNNTTLVIGSLASIPATPSEGSGTDAAVVSPSSAVPSEPSAPATVPGSGAVTGISVIDGSAATAQNSEQGKAAVRVSITSSAVVVGEEIQVQIAVSGVQELFSAPFYFYYDPAMLSLESMSEGDFLRQDGRSTTFLKSMSPALGRVIVGLSRMGAVPGVSGSGTLVTVTLKAKAPGHAVISLANANFKDPALNTLPVQTSAGEVEIR